MFRTTTTYVPYHNNISSVPQEHIFSTTTTYLQYHKNICSDPIRVLFFPARGRHRLLIDSLYYGYTCPCCHSHTSSSPQYIVALHISNASAASISTHHCGAWLRTEYDTAVIQAHNAADWQSFLRNKDVMPNLRWMPTTSPNPESSHEAYWKAKLTLPVDDPFWSKHHPGYPGTASAPSNRPTNPSTAPMTSTALTHHRENSKTIRERTATHSRITTRTTQTSVAAVIFTRALL